VEDRGLVHEGEVVAREAGDVGVLEFALQVHAHLAVARHAHERQLLAPGDAEARCLTSH